MGAPLTTRHPVPSVARRRKSSITSVTTAVIQSESTVRYFLDSVFSSSIATRFSYPVFQRYLEKKSQPNSQSLPEPTVLRKFLLPCEPSLKEHPPTLRVRIQGCSLRTPDK